MFVKTPKELKILKKHLVFLGPYAKNKARSQALALLVASCVWEILNSMPPLQLEKSEAVRSGRIYIVSFRILQILTVRSIPRRALLYVIKTFCSVIPICFNITQPWPLQQKKKGKVKRFSVLVYISLPLKLLFLLSSVWMLPMFSFLSNHIPFIFLDKHENILRSLPGEKLRFCVTATRLYHICTSLPAPHSHCEPVPSQKCFSQAFGTVRTRPGADSHRTSLTR